MPLLPLLVQREGVIITPIQPSMLMYVNLYSTDKGMDEKFLFNYATVKMIPEIQRTKGVARAQILGSRRYAMRIWLNPARMRAYNISVEEVMDAIGEQSIIGRPGRIGANPIRAGSIDRWNVMAAQREGGALESCVGRARLVRGRDRLAVLIRRQGRASSYRRKGTPGWRGRRGCPVAW